MYIIIKFQKENCNFFYNEKEKKYTIKRLKITIFIFNELYILWFNNYFRILD